VRWRKLCGSGEEEGEGGFEGGSRKRKPLGKAAGVGVAVTQQLVAKRAALWPGRSGPRKNFSARLKRGGTTRAWVQSLSKLAQSDLWWIFFSVAQCEQPPALHRASSFPWFASFEIVHQHSTGVASNKVVQLLSCNANLHIQFSFSYLPIQSMLNGRLRTGATPRLTPRTRTFRYTPLKRPWIGRAGGQAETPPLYNALSIGLRSLMGAARAGRAVVSSWVSCIQFLSEFSAASWDDLLFQEYLKSKYLSTGAGRVPT
jgi:hypothetical protein